MLRASVRQGMVGNRAPWTMVAHVVIANSYGPDCSYKGFPNVVISGDDINAERPTTARRVDDVPEEWVDLRWTRKADGSSEYEGRVGYFLVYTTQETAEGAPCPDDRVTEIPKLKVYLPGIGDPFVSGSPVYAGPQLSTCDGRIGVTPVGQAPAEITKKESSSR